MVPNPSKISTMTEYLHGTIAQIGNAMGIEVQGIGTIFFIMVTCGKNYLWKASVREYPLRVFFCWVWEKWFWGVEKSAGHLLPSARVSKGDFPNTCLINQIDTLASPNEQVKFWCKSLQQQHFWCCCCRYLPQNLTCSLGEASVSI